MDDYAECGLEGAAGASVKIGAFNKILRRIGIYHIEPLKKATITMQSHVEECALLQAQIAGGIRVIMWVLSGLTGVVAAVVIAAIVAMIKRGVSL